MVHDMKIVASNQSDIINLTDQLSRSTFKTISVEDALADDQSVLENEDNFAPLNLVLKDASNEAKALSYMRYHLKGGHSYFWDFIINEDLQPTKSYSFAIEVLEQIFAQIQNAKINVEIVSSNQKTLFYLSKLGFQKEGCFKDFIILNGKKRDVLRLSLSYEQWSANFHNIKTYLLDLSKIADSIPKDKFKIAIISDKNSWLNDHIPTLIDEWTEAQFDCSHVHNVSDLRSADFCFCIGMFQILPKTVLKKFTHTLVVHESDLPRGRGWSPLTWQVLENQNRICFSLIEASEEIDAGVIYKQKWVTLNGHELLDELWLIQAETTIELCRWFVINYPVPISDQRTQSGVATYYRRRTPEDSLMDVDKSLLEQFGLLRVVDNDAYPAFFELNGHRYLLRIMKRSVL